MVSSRALDYDVPIIQYWHDESVPPEIVSLTETFRAQNPEMGYRLFHRDTARDFIAERLGPRELHAFEACAVPAMQADYFRYCAILALGGIYVDADFRCLQPLSSLASEASGGLLFRKEPPGHLVNGIFLFRTAAHPLLRLTLDVTTTNIEGRVTEEVYAATGPLIFNGLEFLLRAGSFDAARDQVAGTRFEHTASSMMEAVEDYGRVEEAFADVKVASLDRAMAWIGHSEIPLPHRRTDLHWVKWGAEGRSIYR